MNVSRLADLGTRICIIGPSNSGKSTLAALIGRKQGLPVVHLDILRHETGGYDRLRPEEAFHADHDVAIGKGAWVIEGNYSSCLAARIERSTGLILLDCPTIVSLWRYVLRCHRPARRVGGLPGIERDPVRVSMLRHIVGPTRRNRRRYRQVFESVDRPRIALPGPCAYRAFCRREGLSS